MNWNEISQDIISLAIGMRSKSAVSRIGPESGDSFLDSDREGGKFSAETKQGFSVRTTIVLKLEDILSLRNGRPSQRAPPPHPRSSCRPLLAYAAQAVRDLKDIQLALHRPAATVSRHCLAQHHFYGLQMASSDGPGQPESFNQPPGYL